MQDKITRSLVRGLMHNPRADDVTVFDTMLARFAIRAKRKRITPQAAEAAEAADGEGGDSEVGTPAPKASAWYFIRYTSPVTGRETRMSIGSPATMPDPDKARTAARQKLALVDQGRDPAVEQAERLEVPTIKDLIASYTTSTEFLSKGAKTQEYDKVRLAQHIEEHIGAKMADAITAQVAKGLFTKIAKDTRVNKRKRKLGGAGAARKALLTLAAMLAWAKGEGLIKAVPFSLRELKLAGDGQRDAVITSAAEYAALFSVIDARAAEGKLRGDVRAFLILVASTGMRRGEAQGLTWGQVNLKDRRITLSASKGAKLSRQAGNTAGVEIIGLPPIAADALSRIKPEKVLANTRVFAPQKGKQIAVNRDWTLVRKAAGLPDNLTLHGLRHSVGTVAAIGGMSMPELQALLRHRQPGTTARYLHFAQASGGLADKAMGGVLPALDAPSGEVVKLHKGAA